MCGEFVIVVRGAGVLWVGFRKDTLKVGSNKSTKDNAFNRNYSIVAFKEYLKCQLEVDLSFWLCCVEFFKLIHLGLKRESCICCTYSHLSD